MVLHKPSLLRFSLWSRWASKTTRYDSETARGHQAPWAPSSASQRPSRSSNMRGVWSAHFANTLKQASYGLQEVVIILCVLQMRKSVLRASPVLNQGHSAGQHLRAEAQARDGGQTDARVITPGAQSPAHETGASRRGSDPARIPPSSFSSEHPWLRGGGGGRGQKAGRAV